MLIRLLLRWLAGYVEADCTGGFPERFLSACMRRGLDVFDAHISKSALSLCVSVRDYAAAARAARSCQCRLKLRRRHGLRFPLHGLRQRGPLTAGLAAFFAVLYLLGNCVVTVEIAGSSLVSKGTLTAVLREHGLRAGMLRRDVRVDYIEQNVLMDLPQLAWIAVNLSYGKATVEVTDKAPVPAALTGGENGMIVSACDAQIRRIELESGTALVKPGDVVAAGQPLVVPAPALPGSWAAGVKATVLAYTAHEAEFTLPRVYVRRAPTGASVRCRKLRFLSQSVPLGAQGSPYALCDTQSHTRALTLFDVELPVSVVEREYAELADVSVELDERQAAQLLRELYADHERRTLGAARILHREVSTQATPDGWRCTVRWLCEESVGAYIQIE